MRRRRRRSLRAEPMSEINITPFTDVLLVLLIIFLLAGSAVPSISGVPLETAPAAGGPDSKAPPEAPILVLVDAAGGLRDVRGRPFGEARLGELPRAAELHLSAPEERSVELLIEAHDRLVALGFARVSFAPPESSSF